MLLPNYRLKERPLPTIFREVSGVTPQAEIEGRQLEIFCKTCQFIKRQIISAKFGIKFQ